MKKLKISTLIFFLLWGSPAWSGPGDDTKLDPDSQCRNLLLIAPGLLQRLGLSPGKELGQGSEFRVFQVTPYGESHPQALMLPKIAGAQARAPWQKTVRDQLPTKEEPKRTWRNIYQTLVQKIWGRPTTTGQVLPIYQIDEDSGALLARYVSSDLAKEIDKKEDRLSIIGLDAKRKDQLEFLDVLLDAVSELHENGVLHRDIKPANILIETETVRGKRYAKGIYVGDLGLSVIYGAGSVPEDWNIQNHQNWEFPPNANPEFAVGSPYYMSPEALRARRVARVDIFGIQITFAEVLFGKRFGLIAPKNSYYDTPVFGENVVPRLKGSLDRFIDVLDPATVLLLHHPFVSIREFREVLGEAERLSRRGNFKKGLLTSSLNGFTKTYLEKSLLPLIERNPTLAVQTVFSSPLLIQLFQEAPESLWSEKLKILLVSHLAEYVLTHERDMKVSRENTWLIWREVIQILREYRERITRAA